MPKALIMLAVALAIAPSAFAQTAAPQGVYASDIDTRAQPCDDFFQYANGAWHAANPVPATQSRWSRRWEAEELAKSQLREILEAAAAPTNTTVGGIDRQIGDFYAACMNEAAIERLGLEPVQPLLDQVAKLRTQADVGAMIAQLHAIAIDVPFKFTGGADVHNPSQAIAQISAAGRGRGLPDRDYYLKTEPRFVAAREEYTDYIHDLFVLTAMPESQARQAAQTVLKIETALARASLDSVALRTPKNMDNKFQFDDLRKLTPTFDWKAYYAGRGLQPGLVNVAEVELLRQFDLQMRTASIADWRTYLTWHVLDSVSSSLPSAFSRREFEFRSAYLRGEREMSPRWKQCVDAADSALGEALGRRYVEKFFPPEAKVRVEQLVRNLLLATGEIIDGLDWMDAATKTRAREKLATFRPKVGYPDVWRDYSSVKVRRDAFWENVLAGRRFAVQDQLASIGKPVDRDRWDMTPPTSNAGYRAVRNEIVFPAGILQPPAFRMDASDAINYGAIGVIIGHEISHGFDDKGSQFDSLGRLSNWWQPRDLEKFRERTACVVKQFDNYLVEPGIHHNGRMTLGENIADLASVRIAYRGLQIAQREKPLPRAANGMTPEQEFFVSWGQWRGDMERPEFARSMMQEDSHATGRYRVIGPLSNLPEFRQAFSCPATSPMVRAAAERCEVW